MIRSLRLKFLLMTIGISAIAVAAVVLLSSRTTTVELHRYVNSVGERDLGKVRDLLAEQYKKGGDWNGAESALEQFGKMTGNHFLLVGTSGQTIATYPKELAKAEISFTPQGDLSLRQREDNPSGQASPKAVFKIELELSRSSSLEIQDVGGSTVAFLYPLPVPSPTEVGNREAVIHSVNRSLVLAALAVMAVALLVTFTFARHILGPVEALTRAVRLMGKGELSQHVEARSKDEIGELSQAFNEMTRSLTRLEALRRNMVSDIAHELRSPLTNLRCQIEALQDGLAAPSTAAFHSLYEETMLLNRLIDDLQDLALAEAGQLRFERQPVATWQTVSQAIGAFAVQAEGRAIALKHAIPSDIPHLYADEKRVGQVLRNLLSNAIAHTPRGGAVEIQARPAGEEIELVVKDTGSGVEPEHLPNIFERFYRTDNSRARATGGAGLGLAIVKQLVELQGGRVWAVNNPGKGLSIFVRFPKYDASKVGAETSPRR